MADKQGEIANSGVQDLKVPATITEFIEAVESMPSGAFLRGADQATRCYMASLFGGPFYAASHWAPHLWQRPQLSVVLGGELRAIPDFAGRWLSLYAKGIGRITGVLPRIACTICTPVKPPNNKVPKAVLMQQAHSVVLKDWAQHLAGQVEQPDILALYPSANPVDWCALIERLQKLPMLPENVFVAMESRTHAVIFREMLRRCAFEVDSVLQLPIARFEDGVGLGSLGPGSCWVRFHRRGEISPRGIQAGDLVIAALVYRNAVSGENFDELAEVDMFYGRRLSIEVEEQGKRVNGIFLGNESGLDVDSGQVFHSNEGRFTSADMSCHWGMERISEAVKAKVPPPVSDPDDAHLQVVIWLGMAVRDIEGELESDEHDGSGADDGADAADAGEERDVKEAEAADQAAAPEASVEDAASAAGKTRDASEEQLVASVLLESDDADQALIEQDERAPSAVHELDPPRATVPATPPPPRSRLSRSAGSINVMVLAGRIGGAGVSKNEAFAAARDRVLAWIARRGFDLPESGGSLHVENPEGEISVETDGSTVWAMRYDDRRDVASGAFWRVELALVQAEHPAIGVRLYQVRQVETAPAPVSGVPKILASLADEFGLFDAGMRLLPRATRLEGTDGFETLKQLLIDSNRVQPVIVVAGAQWAGVERTVDMLAERLVGTALVVMINPSIGYGLSNVFGKERSVFGRALRIYRPGFSEQSDPREHRYWRYLEHEIPRRTIEDVVEEVFAISLERGDFEQRVPSFHRVRTQMADARLIALRKQTEQIASTAEEERARAEKISASLEARINELSAMMDEQRTHSTDLRHALKATERERDTALDEVRQLKRQLESRWTMPQEPVIETPDAEETPYPDSWEDLETWVEIYGQDKLVLLPQAAKAARESSFRNIPLAYKALDYLVTHYIPMKNRSAEDEGVRKAHDQALAALGMEVAGVGMALEQKPYKKQYRRMYNGREIVLDMHLKRGTSHDPSIHFRCYFFYDADAGKVIVGHLPSHLKNRHTHTK